MNYGFYVRAERERQNMSVSELARRSGLAKQTIRNWESGDFIPTIYNLEKVLKGLGKGIEIMDLEESPED